MGEWVLCERGDLFDADGDVRCPVEGCSAVGPGMLQMIGSEEWTCLLHGHEWDVERGFLERCDEDGVPAWVWIRSR